MFPARYWASSVAVHDVTVILEQINRGDLRAADELLPLVHEELRKLVAAKMAREASGCSRRSRGNSALVAKPTIGFPAQHGLPEYTHAARRTRARLLGWNLCVPAPLRESIRPPAIRGFLTGTIRANGAHIGRGALKGNNLH